MIAQLRQRVACAAHQALNVVADRTLIVAKEKRRRTGLRVLAEEEVARLRLGHSEHVEKLRYKTGRFEIKMLSRDQLLEDVYGNRTLDNYLNPAAFAYPANGTLGDHVINSIEGPGFWSIDLAVSRLLTFSKATRSTLMPAWTLPQSVAWSWMPQLALWMRLFSMRRSQLSKKRSRK